MLISRQLHKILRERTLMDVRIHMTRPQNTQPMFARQHRLKRIVYQMIFSPIKEYPTVPGNLVSMLQRIFCVSPFLFHFCRFTLSIIIQVFMKVTGSFQP